MHHAAGSSAVAFAQEDCASLLGIQKWVEQRLASADDEAAFYPLRLASNKMHVAIRRVLESEPRAWATLCGWRFGVAPAGAVKRLRSAVYEGATACDNCRRTAARAGIGLDGVFAAGPMSGVLAGNGPPAAPLAVASSSSDEESDSSGID